MGKDRGPFSWMIVVDAADSRQEDTGNTGRKLKIVDALQRMTTAVECEVMVLGCRDRLQVSLRK